MAEDGQTEDEHYRDAENLRPQGPPRKRKSTLSEMLPVRISPELLKSLRSRAEQEDRSMGWIVRRAIERYLGA
jgi:predicted HicB family RNase H-like nuclease